VGDSLRLLVTRRSWHLLGWNSICQSDSHLSKLFISSHIFKIDDRYTNIDRWSIISDNYLLNVFTDYNYSDSLYFKSMQDKSKDLNKIVLYFSKYQISAINSCWEKCDEKCAYTFNVYKNQLSRQTGSRNLMGPKMLPTISNYWWQKSDIWSQASYRYPISWEAFLDPSDSYFLFADFVDFFTHRTYIRNLMDPKTLPTIWGTYMKLVTKYQISAINSCWKKCDEKWAYMFNAYKNILVYLCPSKIFFVAFFSITVDGRNLIFGHKRHIGIPYCG
jgi:hypothetical protein